MNKDEDHAPSKRAEAARSSLEDLASELYWEPRPTLSRETLETSIGFVALIDELIIARIEQASDGKGGLGPFLDALRSARGEK